MPRILVLLSCFLVACHPAGENDPCAGGVCESPCDGVTCDEPPADACADLDHLEVFDPDGTCQQVTGSCLYESELVACDHGCTEGACRKETPDAFELEIEPGRRLCTWGGEGSIEDVPDSLLRRAEMWMKGGTLRLLKASDEFEADLVERLRLGPDGREVSAPDPGRIRHTVQEGPFSIDHHYDYEQVYIDGDGVVTLTIHFLAAIYPEQGETFVMLRDARVGDEVTAAYLGDCPGFGVQPETLELCTGHGDRLTYKGWFARGGTPSFCLGTEATYHRGDDERHTADYFHVGCACGHHCDDQTVLMWFEEPLGDLHGVMADRRQEFKLLDAQGEVTEILTYTLCD